METYVFGQEVDPLDAQAQVQINWVTPGDLLPFVPKPEHSRAIAKHHLWCHRAAQDDLLLSGHRLDIWIGTKKITHVIGSFSKRLVAHMPHQHVEASRVLSFSTRTADPNTPELALLPPESVSAPAIRAKGARTVSAGKVSCGHSSRLEDVRPSTECEVFGFVVHDPSKKKGPPIPMGNKWPQWVKDVGSLCGLQFSYKTNAFIVGDVVVSRPVGMATKVTFCAALNQ
jgi:hypothetical protein